MVDTHIGLAVIFEVPAGEDMKSKLPDMYEKVKSGTPDCLYYGFASCGNLVLCREGYKDGKAVLSHMKDVKETFEKVVEKIGKDKIKIRVMGPKSELDIVSPHLAAFGAKMVELDSNAMWLNAAPKGTADTHVTLLPEFVVPEGRMDDFKAGFGKFYDATKNGKGGPGCYYYGFGVGDGSVFCREGYKDAESVLAHGADVKELLAEPLKICGEQGMKLNVVGPKAELEKLKPKLAQRGAIFWELDDGALWR